tara:strand:+ start:508 stop:1293 length:786 start_codon:yes stop_codon:yes gene_type:complete
MTTTNISESRLKFSKDANAKLAGIKAWLPVKNPKVYSLSLLSGFTCPGAKDCQAYAVRDKKTGKTRVVQGRDAIYRCFSASQEAQYPGVYEQRKFNTDLLLKKSLEQITQILMNSIPHDADIIRIHVGGDFFSRDYMEAFYDVARFYKNIKFYAYTKSVDWMQQLEYMRPDNFSMNASYGSRKDSIIDEFNLKSAVVVMHPDDTDLPIDHDEYYAINNAGSFALLLHGTQPKNSPAAEALKQMRKEGIKFSYTKKVKVAVA